MNNSDLTDDEVTSLAGAILQRHGIDFTCYEPNSFKRRLIRAIAVLNLSGIHELWTKVLREEGFMRVLTNEISVGLTSMFRDPMLWIALKKYLADNAHTSEGLRIWHAGCSTGEEVYTMGIVMHEAGLGGHYQSVATDISNVALCAAQKGMYHKIKMLEFEKNYAEYNPDGRFSSYYRREGEYVQFDTELVRQTQFNYHNLISDPFMAKYDIIFCRNVMIYFDNVAKIRLMERFYDSLRPGGLLIVGFYDAISALVDQSLFELMDSEAKIFRARELIFT